MVIKYVTFTNKQLESMIFIDEAGKVQIPINPPKGISYLFEDCDGFHCVMLVKADGEIYESYVLYTSKF